MQKLYSGLKEVVGGVAQKFLHPELERGVVEIEDGAEQPHPFSNAPTAAGKRFEKAKQHHEMREKERRTEAGSQRKLFGDAMRATQSNASTSSRSSGNAIAVPSLDNRPYSDPRSRKVNSATADPTRGHSSRSLGNNRIARVGNASQPPMPFNHGPGPSDLQRSPDLQREMPRDGRLYGNKLDQKSFGIKGKGKAKAIDLDEERPHPNEDPEDPVEDYERSRHTGRRGTGTQTLASARSASEGEDELNAIDKPARPKMPVKPLKPMRGQSTLIEADQNEGPQKSGSASRPTKASQMRTRDGQISQSSSRVQRPQDETDDPLDTNSTFGGDAIGFTIETLCLGERRFRPSMKPRLEWARNELHITERGVLRTTMLIAEISKESLEAAQTMKVPYFQLTFLRSALAPPQNRLQHDVQEELKQRDKDRSPDCVTVSILLSDDGHLVPKFWDELRRRLEAFKEGKKGGGHCHIDYLDEHGARARSAFLNASPSDEVRVEAGTSRETRQSTGAPPHSFYREAEGTAKRRPKPKPSANGAASKPGQAAIDRKPPVTRGKQKAIDKTPIDLDADEEEIEVHVEQSGVSTRTRKKKEAVTIDDPILAPDRPGAGEVMTVYPEDALGAVTITGADFARLDEGEFLNDTLIEYGLKRIFLELSNSEPKLQNDIHVFSSFFYKKLTHKDKKFKAGEDQRKAAYDSVAKWTAKIDMFQKKYIIIPINEHLHWYLAVIINPAGILQAPSEELKDAIAKAKPSAKRNAPVHDGPVRRSARQSNGASLFDSTDPEASILSESKQAAQSRSTRSSSRELAKPQSSLLTPRTEQTADVMQIDDSIESVEVEPEPASREDSLPPADGGSAPTVKVTEAAEEEQAAPSAPEDVADSPYEAPPSAEVYHDACTILYFDSLGGTSTTGHNNVGKILTSYLKREALDKKKVEDPALVYEEAVKTGSAVGCLQQGNFCDCGLFVLHFVRVFLENPDIFIKTSWENKTAKGLDITHWQKPQTEQGMLRAFWRDDILEQQKAYEPTKRKKAQEAQEERERKKQRKREREANGLAVDDKSAAPSPVADLEASNAQSDAAEPPMSPREPEKEVHDVDAAHSPPKAKRVKRHIQPSSPAQTESQEDVSQMAHGVEQMQEMETRQLSPVSSYSSYMFSSKDKAHTMPVDGEAEEWHGIEEQTEPHAADGMAVDSPRPAPSVVERGHTFRGRLSAPASVVDIDGDHEMSISTTSDAGALSPKPATDAPVLDKPTSFPFRPQQAAPTPLEGSRRLKEVSTMLGDRTGSESQSSARVTDKSMGATVAPTLSPHFP